MTEPFIELLEVCRYFRRGTSREVRAVDGITMEFPRDCFTVLAGPSGSGKSSLLSLLGLLDRPTSGSLIIDGLKSVLKTWNSRVVAAGSAHDTIRTLLRPDRLVTPQEWNKHNWIDLESVVFEGCGLGAVAYAFRWEQSDVLVSGNIPSTLSTSSISEWNQSVRVAGRSDGFWNALDALRRQQPNVWLPTHPNGQNANLYDDQWHSTLMGNLRLIDG